MPGRGPELDAARHRRRQHQHRARRSSTATSWCDSWRVKTDARGHRRRAGAHLPRAARATTPDITGVAALLDRARRAARAAHDARALLPPRADVIVEPGAKTGVPVLMDNPKEVGADRIANTLAAHHLYGGPCIVVDFGTSTNFDVVSAKGEFLGGALAPGIEISLDALAAARGPAAQGRAGRAALGRSARTRSRRCSPAPCTASPARSTASSRASSPSSADRSPRSSPRVDSRRVVIRESSTVTVHRPDLTLQGLRLVFDKNT